MEPTIACVVPCHNEEAAVGKVVRDLRAALPEAIVYVYGLRDDAATPEARLAAGSRIALRVEPFESEAAQQRAGSLNRIELDDLELLALPAFLGTTEAKEDRP